MLAFCLFFFAAAPAGSETITVTHWGAAFYGAPYAVAMEKGFFKAKGVDVTGILTSTGGGTSVRNTLAGDLPFGEVALPAVLEAVRSGQPLRIVSSGVESIGDVVFAAKPDSPLMSIKDLLGKKVGYTSPKSVSNMLVLMAMKRAGIEASQVQLIPAGGIGAILAGIETGALDVGNIIEPIWSQNREKLKPVFWIKDFIPANVTQTVGIVTADFAKSGPDKIRAIIAARREGVEFLEQNPDEAADITAKAYSGDAPLFRTVFRHLLEMRYWGKGPLDYDGMNNMVEGMQTVGVQHGAVDWTKLVDSSFLPNETELRR
jgi:NitT/TauT family transport system substrate-binding protein